MANLRERLRAVLGIDTGEFDRGLNQAGQRVRQFGQSSQDSLGLLMSKASGLGTAFMGGLIGGGIVATLSRISSSVRATVAEVASLGDEAKRSGMGLQAFQEWKFVAEQNRIGVDALVDGFKELSLRADEFIVTGGGAGSDAFRRLGLSAADLKQKLKDPSELMLEIVDRLQAVDSAGRIRILDEIFGGAGGEQFLQMLDQGKDGLRQLIQQAHESGSVLDRELVERAQDLDRRFANLTQRVANFGKEAALALADLPFDIIETRIDELFSNRDEARAILGDRIFDELRKVTDLTDEQVEAVGRLKGVYSSLDDVASAASSAILLDLSQVPSTLTEIRGGLSGVATEMRELPALFEAKKITAQEFADRMAAAEVKAQGLFDELERDKGITLSNAISAVGRLGRAITGAIGLARTLKASLPGGVAKEAPGYLDSDGPMPDGWTDVAFPPGDRRNRPGPRAPNDMWWLDPVDTGSSKGGGGGAKKDDWQREIDRITEHTRALEAEAASLAAAAASGGQYAGALEYARRRAELLVAAQKAGKEVTPELTAEIDALARAYVTAGLSADEAADRLRSLEEAGERGADALADIFTSVLSGAKSARGAIADLLMEMAKVQARRAILDLQKSGGGGIFGWIGSMLGGARARGGPVQGGVPYLVNEETPNSEIFVPSGSGAVLSVSQAQAALRSRSSANYASVGLPGGEGSGSGLSHLIIQLSPELEAQWLQKAEGRAMTIARAGDHQAATAARRGLPGQINDLQARGSR